MTNKKNKNSNSPKYPVHKPAASETKHKINKNVHKTERKMNKDRED